MSTFIKTINQYLKAFKALFISGCFGANLATLFLLPKFSKMASYIQHNLFTWRMVKGQVLPQKQFHELFQTPKELSIYVLPTTGYLTYWDAHYTKDVMYLALLAKVLSSKVIFEIGTLHGYTALLFALNTPKEAVIYTLDLPPNGSVKPLLSTTMIDDAHILSHAKTLDYLYYTHPEGKKVNQLYGDSAVFDFTPYHGKVDLFFIDGAHSYEYVRSDSLRALECMKQGGVIVWHDYGRWGVNGVSRFLHELRENGREIYRLPGSSLALLKV